MLGTFHELLEANKVVILFVYGMIFFLMGFGILLKSRQHSRFKLAHSLHWLALFGIVHAFADWGHLFIPLQQAYASEQTYIILRTIRIVINALSFMFMFYFGLSLLIDTKGLDRRLKVFPLAIFLIWLVQMIAYIVFLDMVGDELWWVRMGDIWARYLLALPGTLLAGYAIGLQRQEFIEAGYAEFARYLNMARISLLIYTLAAGLIVPASSFGLARIVNDQVFSTVFGIPIETIRAASGFFLSVSILKVIQVFDMEYITRIQESEKTRAIYDERNRIAQDLHDGIIQSIYASNLELEVVKHLVKEDPDEARNRLDMSLRKRNQIISEIREYIGELKRIPKTQSFKERIEALLDELSVRDRLAVKVECPDLDISVPYATSYHLALVFKEAISNVLKHAQAKNLVIRMKEMGSILHIEISDDGKGFLLEEVEEELAGNRQGLKNMRERIGSIEGNMEIKSVKGRGTSILVTVPVGG